MRAHTFGLDARVNIIAHEVDGRYECRLSAIHSGPASQERVRYVSVALLDHHQWRPGFDEPHQLILAGHLIGQTFQDKLGKENIQQNQLFLNTWVPWFLVPAHLRHFAICEKEVHERCDIHSTDNQPYWWTVEVYDFYATTWAGVGKYGTFVEVAPRGRVFHPRKTLGPERLWRVMGRRRTLRFQGYIRSPQIPAHVKEADATLARCARLIGGFTGVPALYLFGFLGKEAWTRSLRR